jgi:hypothetical protein
MLDYLVEKALEIGGLLSESGIINLSRGMKIADAISVVSYLSMRGYLAAMAIRVLSSGFELLSSGLV